MMRGRKNRIPGIEGLESRLLLAAAPMGYVDILNAGTIAGWAYDPDAGAAAIDVALTIDASTSTLTANVGRPDLGPVLGSSYHGFRFSPAALAPGQHTVKVEAVDPASGQRTTLAQATLSNAAPVGSMDLVSATRLAGWLHDADDPTTPVQFRVDVNGVPGQVQTADLARGDLIGPLGGANFAFDISGDFANKVVELYALDAPSGTATLMYSNNRAPQGWVDTLTTTQINGWALDLDQGAGSVQVRVDIDGVAGTPVTADLDRPDLIGPFGSSAHGFAINLPALTPGKHQVSVLASDFGQAGTPLKVIWTGTVTDAVPTGYVDALTPQYLAGWAYDTDVGAGAVPVSVYVDDVLFTTVTADNTRPDLLAAVGSTDHGFYVDLSTIPAGSHSITVTLHDQISSPHEEVVLYDSFINNHSPIGYIDAAGPAQVSGWAYDQDAGADAINVDVYVDGQFARTARADVYRADLQGAVGSTNHGYVVTLPGMSFGAHKVEVYAAESQGNVSVKIGEVTVTNTAPIGSFDGLDGAYAAGWAFDSDNPSTPLQVALLVDGQIATTTTASAERPDVSSYLQSTNHAFWIALPTLSAGSHEISVLAYDPLSNDAVTLGTRWVVV